MATKKEKHDEVTESQIRTSSDAKSTTKKSARPISKSKNIDGVKKPKKRSSSKSKTSKNTSSKSSSKTNLSVQEAIVKELSEEQVDSFPNDPTVRISAKDTKIAIASVESDSDKESSSTSNSAFEEPSVEEDLEDISITATDTDLANDQDNISAKKTEGKEIKIDIIKNEANEKNGTKSDENDEINEVESLEETEEIEEVKEADEDNQSTDKSSDVDIPTEVFVSNAVLEEEVIDQNLDDLIKDIDETIEEKHKDEKEDKNTEDNQRTTKKSTSHSADHHPEKEISAKNAKKRIPKKARPFRWFSRLLALATSITLIALAIRIYITNIVPLKFFAPAAIIAALFLLFYLFKSFRNKTHIIVLIILNLLGIAITAISIFGFIRINETMSFLNNNFTDTKEYSIFSVIVNKKSNYNDLDDIRGKTFYSISDFVDTSKLESAVSEQANATVSYVDGITSLLSNALQDNSYIAILNSGTYEATLDGDSSNEYKNNLKIIGEIKVESEKTTDHASHSNLTEQSFVLYVSGIDTRSGLMLDRSLSDVNIVISVNPLTKTILMRTSPRDYYVQLHGTSGLPDKLTHAGSLGGVQLSMATIDDLLNINFDRYIRVNFNFVINLVDAIGGITVYSDVDYDITAHTNKNCVFHPGYNDVNGTCALAFARERYAYSDGDRHRGRNQEQVIEKIFAKVTSSSTLIGKYSDILNALSGSFDTDITTSDITSLVNMQLSDMAKWNVSTYNLDGTTGSAYTYSYPNQLLSVMFPDQTTVETAKAKIQQVLTGATETTTQPTSNDTNNTGLEN